MHQLGDLFKEKIVMENSIKLSMIQLENGFVSQFT